MYNNVASNMLSMEANQQQMLHNQKYFSNVIILVL